MLTLESLQKLLIDAKVNDHLLLNYIFRHNFIDIMFDVLELIFRVVCNGDIKFNPSQREFDPLDNANLAELFHVFKYEFLDVLLYCFRVADVVFNIFFELNEDFFLDIIERDFIDSLL